MQCQHGYHKREEIEVQLPLLCPKALLGINCLSAHAVQLLHPWSSRPSGALIPRVSWPHPEASRTCFCSEALLDAGLLGRQVTGAASTARARRPPSASLDACGTGLCICTVLSMCSRSPSWTPSLCRSCSRVLPPLEGLLGGVVSERHASAACVSLQASRCLEDVRCHRGIFRSLFKPALVS